MRTLILISLIYLPLAHLAYGHDIDTYSIQIGTYQNPPAELIESARKFGPVHQLWFNKLTRITVGEFSQESEALKKLPEIRQAGFEDAFVRKIGTAPYHSDHNHLEIQKFNLLAEELNARSLYLNGKMYLKQGDQYIKIP